LVETFVFDLLGERCIPLKVGRIRGVLSESEPAMPRVGSLLVFIFVCEELDVFVFVSFGVLYPVSLVLWIAVPVGEFDTCDGRSLELLVWTSWYVLY